VCEGRETTTSKEKEKNHQRCESRRMKIRLTAGNIMDSRTTFKRERESMIVSTDYGLCLGFFFLSFFL
jgi:hypothetical protein